MTKTEDEPRCPECGAVVTVDDGGIFLMGRKTVKCPGCGVELTATARISF